MHARFIVFALWLFCVAAFAEPDDLALMIRHGITGKLQQGQAPASLLDNAEWVTKVTAELSELANASRSGNRYHTLADEAAGLISSNSTNTNPDAADRRLESVRNEMTQEGPNFTKAIDARIKISSSMGILAELRDPRVVNLIAPVLLLDQPGRAFDFGDYQIGAAPDSAADALRTLRARGVSLPGAKKLYSAGEWARWWRKERSNFQRLMKVAPKRDSQAPSTPGARHNDSSMATGGSINGQSLAK